MYTTLHHTTQYMCGYITPHYITILHSRISHYFIHEYYTTSIPCHGTTTLHHTTLQLIYHATIHHTASHIIATSHHTTITLHHTHPSTNYTMVHHKLHTTLLRYVTLIAHNSQDNVGIIFPGNTNPGANYVYRSNLNTYFM